MAKGAIIKVVGKVDINKIDKDIIEKYNLKEYQNQEIIQNMDLYLHTYKHIQEFKSIDSYNNALFSVEKIIKDPYYIYYDSCKNSLLYFKEIDDDVCAVVKLNLRKNKDTYVSTIYPVNKNKIDRLKQKEKYNKYIVNS